MEDTKRSLSLCVFGESTDGIILTLGPYRGLFAAALAAGASEVIALFHLQISHACAEFQRYWFHLNHAHMLAVGGIRIYTFHLPTALEYLSTEWIDKRQMPASFLLRSLH